MQIKQNESPVYISAPQQQLPPPQQTIITTQNYTQSKKDSEYNHIQKDIELIKELEKENREIIEKFLDTNDKGKTLAWDTELQDPDYV